MKYGFPFLFWSFRTGSLILFIAALVLWPLTGFDIEEGAVPLIGIQFSTFATFFFWFYVVIMSYQIGGVSSLGQFAREFRFDLGYLKTDLKGVFKARENYPREGAVPAIAAIVIGLMICMAATLLFEDIWVPLYNFFEFGSWTWPVYYAVVSKDPLQAPVIRNLVLGILPLLVIGALSNAMSDFGFKLRFRFDSVEIWLVIAAASLWLVWIVFPGSTPIAPSDLTISAIQGPLASTFNASSCYIFPRQIYFPQDTYTFYPCALFMKSYASKQILGFFVPNIALHSINVLAKFITFAAICYPVMATVNRQK